ncbi:hypothetical protein DFJ73DRAFT_787782 [Zopfochytrium polystomum]|nr:hypothetical protein DFJ73DRAFT_787782 [Zopfochytrium polystomum]
MFNLVYAEQVSTPERASRRSRPPSSSQRVSACARTAVVFYACVRALIEGPDFLDFAKMMFVFNVLKRVHSIVAVHITFLRLQIVTGPLQPRPRGFQRIQSRSPARHRKPAGTRLTLVYALVGFGAVGFQLHAYLSGNWNGPASRGHHDKPLVLLRLRTPYAAHLNPTPVSPLAAVVLFLTFVACSIVYFWDPFFNVSVFVEQEDDAGPPAGAGGGSGRGAVGQGRTLQTAADVWKVNPSGLGGDAQMELQQRRLNAPPASSLWDTAAPAAGPDGIASPGYAGGGVNLGGMGSPIGFPAPAGVEQTTAPNIYNGSGGGGMGVAFLWEYESHGAGAAGVNMYSRNF